MANGMGSLWVGASGLQNAQNGLNTTANNISNVDTTGYVRQQVVYGDRNYINFNKTASISYQQAGLGVTIADVVHARDIFLDKTYRTENGRYAFYSTTYEAVSEIENYFQELEGDAFEDILTGDSGLWVAFQEFAKDPSDSVNQNLVLQKSELFLTRAKAVCTSMRTYQDNLNEQIKDSVERVNELGETICELNKQIQAIEAAGVETAYDLRDARDNALDELSSYGKISYRELANGIVKVSFEDVEFVDELKNYTIGMRTDDLTGFVTPVWDHMSDESQDVYRDVFNFDGEISTAKKNDIGSLKALCLARGDGWADYSDIEGVTSTAYDKGIAKSVMLNVEAEFDQLIHNIVTAINDAICPNIEATSDITGYDSSGNAVTISAGTLILDTDNCATGADGVIPPAELFVRTGCDRYTTVYGNDGTTYYVYNEEDTSDTSLMYTVNSVHINEDLMKYPTNLANLSQDGSISYELGETLAAIWSETNLTLNPNDTTPVTFAEYYSKMTGELATVGDVYNSTAQGLDSTVTTVDNARLQVTGVSSDEELTNMIKYQNAYNASSRFINVVSEMLEYIITQLG
ncbi:MAG: flagellar hook-associated protein FlgK [Lachnospiraceae bacterium]|nr:flagellar hook-associated protein FlgK [Lachnospiraceae bacterium]